MSETKVVTFQVTAVTQKVTVFCRAIDYYGDVGVCLRLARALTDLGCAVVMVLDRPDLARAMDPPGQFPAEQFPAGQISAGQVPAGQFPAGQIRLASWDAPPDPSPHELVIEAFQALPPHDYLQACGPGVRRVCLDYLATEAWADGLQALPAPDPAFPAHSRIWLAPSFSPKGPGLIRGRWEEIDAETRRTMRQRLVAHGADSADSADSVDSVNGMNGMNDMAVGMAARRSFLVLAFGYDDAPWDALARVMQQEGLPEGFDRVCFVKPSGLDFSQREFDAVLQSCDLNFVRGEDSFVRAHFAAAGRWRVPFVWQPYRQAAGAHLDKLGAWQERVRVLHAHEQQSDRVPSDRVPSDRVPKAMTSPDSGLANPPGVWQSWLAMQAVFNPPEAPANLESLRQLAMSWQHLQQNWDVFRNAFSDACRKMIPGRSLEQTLVDLNDDWP